MCFRKSVINIDTEVSQRPSLSLKFIQGFIDRETKFQGDNVIYRVTAKKKNFYSLEFHSRGNIYDHNLFLVPSIQRWTVFFISLTLACLTSLMLATENSGSQTECAKETLSKEKAIQSWVTFRKRMNSSCHPSGECKWAMVQPVFLLNKAIHNRHRETRKRSQYNQLTDMWDSFMFVRFYF